MKKHQKALDNIIESSTENILKHYEAQKNKTNKTTKTTKQTNKKKNSNKTKNNKTTANKNKNSKHNKNEQNDSKIESKMKTALGKALGKIHLNKYGQRIHMKKPRTLGKIYLTDQAPEELKFEQSKNHCE